METSTSEMELFWKWHIRIFQWLCVSHFSIYRPNFFKNHITKLVYFGYFTLFITIDILIFYYLDSIYLNIKIENDNTFTPLVFIVNCLSIIAFHVHHISMELETFLCGNKERKLHQIFVEINQLFTEKIKRPIDYKILFKYNLKTVIPFFIFTTIAVFILTFQEIIEHNPYAFVLSRIFCTTLPTCRQLYIALILKMLNDCIIHLKSTIQNDQEHFQNNIHYYRQIYSKFYQITDLFSNCFGYTMLTLIAEYFFSFISLIYYMYLEFYIAQDAILFASKKISIQIDK